MTKAGASSAGSTSTHTEQKLTKAYEHGQLEYQEGNVPNYPSLPVFIFYKTIGFAIFLFLLPLNLLYRTILHYTKGPPHPTWSLSKHLIIANVRLYLSWAERWVLPRPEGKAGWKEKKLVQKLFGEGTRVKEVRIPKAQGKWVAGYVLVDGVVPEDVPGFWTYPDDGQWWVEGDEPAREEEKIYVYVSGGSWVIGHPQGTNFPYGFVQGTGKRVFSLNYRKAISSETAWPAQMLDILAAYQYVQSVGFKPESIAFVGDSSGAHIILALTRYIAELKDAQGPELIDLGMPRTLFLISPSGDIAHPPFDSISTDILVPYINIRAVPSLCRHYPASALREDPYFSPAICGSFAYLALAGVKVWVQYGDVELMRPDIVKVIERIREGGVDVEVDVITGGVHEDAGIMYALGERGSESSWGRLVEALVRLHS